MDALEIHVHESQIIVNLRGTRLTITYGVSPDEGSLVEQPFWTGDDRSAPISLNEFRESAWLAAKKKAHEIGWISEDAMLFDDRRHIGAVDSAELLSLATKIGVGRGLASQASQKEF